MSIDDTNQGVIDIDLKYGEDGEKVIRTSGASARPAAGPMSVEELHRVRDGLGISIVSTNRGVLSDRQCRSQRVGGEVLCDGVVI
jgi:small subunit ribosomal protein S8